jgi:hypothetical protein
MYVLYGKTKALSTFIGKQRPSRLWQVLGCIQQTLVGIGQDRIVQMPFGLQAGRLRLQRLLFSFSAP